MSIRGDRPARDIEDRYGFAAVADKVARAVARINQPDGLVVGVEGEWGSGKTSLANMIVNRLSRTDPFPLIVRYNAWTAGNESEAGMGLLLEIKRELEKQGLLSTNLAKGAAQSAIDLFGKLGAPDIKGLGRFGHKAGQMLLGVASVNQLKETLGAVLDAMNRRLYVFVDDLDRTPAHHLRVIFGTIKTICDLPNLIFILALDKTVIASALAEIQGGDGFSYYEKIVALSIPVPYVTSSDLLDEFVRQLSEEIGTPLPVTSERHWQSILSSGVLPYLKKPRDVVRLANTILFSYDGMKDEVALEDFVALETMRVFEPAIYDFVKCSSTSILRNTSDKDLRDQISSEIDREVDGNLLILLKELFHGGFPAPKRATRRICFEDKFPVYFQFASVVEALSEANYRSAVAASKESVAAFASYLDAIRGRSKGGRHSMLQALVWRLHLERSEDEDAFQAENVIGAFLRKTDDFFVELDLDVGYKEAINLVHSVCVIVRQNIDRLFYVPSDIASGSYIVAALFLKEARENRFTEMKYQFAIREFEESFLVRCNEDAATDAFLRSPFLETVLSSWAALSGEEAVRARLPSQLSNAQAANVVESFLRSADATREGPFFSGGDFGRALSNLGRFFDDGMVEKALDDGGQASRWVRIFRNPL